MAALLFLALGTQKLLGFPATERVTETFSLGWFAGVLELFGGAAIVLGYQTRSVAFVLSGLTAFAYWLAHAPRSFHSVNNGGDAAILFCFVFLHFVFAGAGRWSLDAWLGRERSSAAA